MKHYQRGDVVIIDMPFAQNSSIQGGKRPWVIVQNDIGNAHSPTTIVCPLTTKLKRLEMPTHYIVAWEKLSPSMVSCEQLRVVDVRDDWEFVTTLPKQIMDHVDKAIMNTFFMGKGLNENG